MPIVIPVTEEPAFPTSQEEIQFGANAIQDGWEKGAILMGANVPVGKTTRVPNTEYASSPGKYFAPASVAGWAPGVSTLGLTYVEFSLKTKSSNLLRISSGLFSAATPVKHNMVNDCFTHLCIFKEQTCVGQ